MANRRVWLFRILIIIAIGLLVTSWLLPWWSAHIHDVPGQWPISIHPYGLDASQMWEFLTLMPEGGAEAEMPVWFTPAMWFYLGLIIALLLYSAWIKDKNISILGKKFGLPKLLIIVIGLSYMVVCGLMVVVASMRLEAIGIHFTGYTFVNLGNYAVWVLETSVDAFLRFGFWLACGVGPLLVILGLLRNRIIGSSRSVSQ